MEKNVPPHSLGLGGDGDEIDAIEEVERRFGVNLDYSDASHWRTAGDVFRALERSLSSECIADEQTWKLFTEAISRETGVDPTQVTRDTLLLGTARFDWRMVLIAIIVGLTVFAVGHFW